MGNARARNAGIEVAFASVEAMLEVMRSAIRVFRAALQRSRERRLQRQAAWATYDALRRLDDRTLKDIGYHRGALASVSATMNGEESWIRK